MRDEMMDYDQEGLRKRVERKRARRGLDDDARGSPVPQQRKTKVSKPPRDHGEKWTPAEESEGEEVEDVQRHREKVYSEYLDSVKAEALESGNEEKYNKVERNFLKRYEQAALKDNKDTTGQPFRLSSEQRDYAKDIEGKQSILQYRKNQRYQANKKYNEKSNEEVLSDEEDGQETFDRINRKPRKDIAIKQNREESLLRDKNENFMYRYNYTKEHPEAEKDIEFEETLAFKMLKKHTHTPKEFNDSVKNLINTEEFTEKEFRQNFKRKLNEGSISIGLEARDRKLNLREHDKDLSEIANADSPDHQSIYKQYMKHKTPQHVYNKEEEIRQRELEFLEAVKEDHKETTPKLSRSFQEYEDYKRIKQLRGEEKGEIVNKTPEDTGKITKRDWLAKLWSGTLTPDEYEKYMININYTQDKRGMSQIIYTQKEHPGYGAKPFISSEDAVRLYREIMEEKRRTAILNGQVTEAESFKYMEDLTEDMKEFTKFLNSQRYKMMVEPYYQYFHAITAGEQVREYYFDPKQGVSLEEHLKAVAKTNPKAKLETYADKDGFTVVKKTIKNEYKYNIDDILDNSPEDIKKAISSKLRGIVEKETTHLKGKLSLINLIL